MKIFSLVLFLGLLIGRNLPFDEFILYGLGPWDFIAVIFGVFMLFANSRSLGITSTMVGFIFLFLLSGLVGIFANIRFGFRLTDIFEVLRILYCLLLVRMGGYFGKILTIFSIKSIVFLSGIIIFIFAYQNPMNDDVLGFVQIWNPNVVGNALIFHVILIILLSDKTSHLSDFFYAVFLLAASFFTYSKASWLLILVIMPYLILTQTKTVKIGLILTSVLLACHYSNELLEISNSIEILVESKISASGFDKSASQGSSVGARYGLALSGLLMFLKSPIVGVGIGNFEQVNLMLRSDLGSNFYVDDNANSLVFHYLGTTGLLGCLAVLMIIYLFYREAVKGSSKTLAILTLTFILISINFQREMFTSNVMWLFIGIFTCINKKSYDSFIRPRV